LRWSKKPVLPCRAMVPTCCLVNFTPDPLDWLLQLCVGDHDRSKTEFPWTIETKYYRALVNISIKQAGEVMASSSPAPWLAGMEAVMFYCDTSKATLARVEEVWSRIKEAAPAVCLLVVESASDQNLGPGEASRTEVMAWCLDHHFELVECDEGEEEEEVEEGEDEGIDEKLGRARVVEALKAHTWSNLQLLESGGGGTLQEDSSDEEGEVSDQVRSLMTAVDTGEEEDFGALFSQLASMREQSSNLQQQDRKAYAEQVAMAFYKAIGEASDDDEH